MGWHEMSVFTTICSMRPQHVSKSSPSSAIHSRRPVSDHLEPSLPSWLSSLNTKFSLVLFTA
jgi:hypothetical protein